MMLRPLIFETDKDGYVIDERAKWFPDFKELSQEQMTYVAWITDYNSPVWKKPDTEKRTFVADKIYRERKVEIEHDGSIDAACQLYNTIQYDRLVEQYKSQMNIHDVYTRGLNQESAMGTSKQNVERIKTATQMQKDAEVEIERLEVKIRERIVEDSKTRGQKATNFYETWRQKNNVTALAMEGIKNYENATKK